MRSLYFSIIFLSICLSASKFPDFKQFTSDIEKTNSSLIFPDDPNFQTCVKQFDDLFSGLKPFVIVYATNREAVAISVKFAIKYNIQISVRSGGNSNLGWGVCNGCLVVDLSRMRGLKVIPNPGNLPMLRVEPGVNNKQLIATLTPLGLAIPNGDCPTVCIGGYSTGGGFSLQMRSLGLNIDSILELQVVNSTGHFMTCSLSENPQLFWALRGGGGINFGIVVSVLYQSHPLPPKLVGGTLYWPLEMYKEVTELYYDTLWDEKGQERNIPFGFSLALINNIPETKGETVLVLSGLYFSTNLSLGKSLLEPFVKLPKTTNYIIENSFDQIMWSLMEGPYFDNLNWTMPDAMIDRLSKPNFLSFIQLLIEWEAKKPENLLVTWVYAPLGGKVNQVDSRATAFPHRTSGGNFHMPTAWLNPDDEKKVVQWLDDVLFSTSNYWTKSRLVDYAPMIPMSYINHPSITLRNYSLSYHDINYPDLLRLKKRYDPANFFRNGQSIM